jgi:gamma-glutamyl-gamma-aminobutyrate hydrolase PuuD
MIVGITMRSSPVSYCGIQEQRDALAHDWFKLFQKLAVTPILIPNALSDPAEYVEKIGVSHLLLSGGDSLGPLAQEYQSAEIKDNSIPLIGIASGMPTNRDLTEAALLNWALKKSIPVLGICRGLQMINAYFGGSITRSLIGNLPQEPHVACMHKIQFVSGPFAGRDYYVNSYHDDGVLRTNLAPSLEILAETKGGVVEALRYPNKPISAIQWHPERYESLYDIDNFFLQAWLEGE